MSKNLTRHLTKILILLWHVTIYNSVSKVSCQDLSFSEGATLDFNPNFDPEHQHTKISHFLDEHTFMDRFGPEDQIIKIFSNTTLSSPDPIVPGDMGTGVTIQSPIEDIQRAIKEGYDTYSFNKYVSDMIPVQRRLQDHRNQWCLTPDRFLKNMLPTSVIMCFYNEALSTLLRSIHSILDRTPSHLLEEIILIDDFSDHDELMDKLESKIENLPKVKLIRLPQREGLIRARLIGSDMAVAPILTFLDSHIEASEGWLEPLLDRVTRSWKTIAVPYLDHIDCHTLAYNATSDDRMVGGFTWNLMFAWKSPTEQDLKEAKTLADPFTSPTMTGGLFSIHRDFFEHLSKYDDQYEIWGAENLELSFKAWLCGGRIEIVPCSRVAHLERGVSPYKRDHYKKNVARLAAVWLDEYSEFYFLQNTEKIKDYGDVSSRMAEKKRMNCSSFDWYMNNIVPDMFNPKHAVASGEVKNLDFNGAYCLDSHIGNSATAESPWLYWNCHGDGGNQNWYYSANGEIRIGQKCLDYFGTNVTLLECHKQRGNQHWEYHADTGVIVHSVSRRCLTLDVDFNKVGMAECQGEMQQRWQFKKNRFHEVFKDFDFKWRRHELFNIKE